MSLRSRLEALVAGLPEEGSVSVPVRWLRDVLDQEPKVEERDRLYTVDQLADRYDRSPSTVREWLAAGEVPGAFKIHGSWRVAAQDVAEFENRRRRGALGSGTNPTLSQWRDSERGG